MAGPPDDSHCVITAFFSGVALPNGAATTIGALWPDSPPGPLLEAVAGAFAALHDDIATTDARIERIMIKRGPEATGPTYERAVSINGGQGTAADAPNVSFLIKKQAVGVSGRFHGRMFYPGVEEGATNSGGVLRPEILVQYQAAVDAFDNALNDAGLLPRVFGENGAIRVIEALNLDARVASQRLRNRR